MRALDWANRIAASFVMSDGVWRRHANPWSFWTRLIILPLFALALWSRVWIGWWALAPLALVVVWTWINPRAFPPPATTDRWVSKAVLGERVWLARDRIAIPSHHAVAANLLSAVAALGVPFYGWGLYALEIWPTLFGMSLMVFGKLWFVDRMVWLYEDMKDASPEYRSWLY
jgi:hypothetical protein